MIATSKFVLLHLHKTGVQTLNSIIGLCIPDCKTIGYHWPVELLPSDYQRLPLIGIIRNPWDWYVSWFAFNMRPDVQNPLFDILSDRRQKSFHETVSSLVNLGSDSAVSQQYRRSMMLILPETLAGNVGIGLTRNDIFQFQDNESGYLSWLANRMFGNLDNANTFIGRFETLQSDFLGFMESLQVSQIDAMRFQFSRIAKKNTSLHSHYSVYYNEELRDLVFEKDRMIIELFDYHFEDQKRSEKIIDLNGSQPSRNDQPASD